MCGRENDLGTVASLVGMQSRRKQNNTIFLDRKSTQTVEKSQLEGRVADLHRIQKQDPSKFLENLFCFFFLPKWNGNATFCLRSAVLGLGVERELQVGH